MATNCTYSKSQIAAINRAWDFLIAFADRWDVHSKYRLLRALKQERRDRKSIHYAKGCMLGSMSHRDNPYSAADLYTLSDGCAQAAIFAAYYRTRRNAQAQQDWISFQQGALMSAADAVTGNRP